MLLFPLGYLKMRSIEKMGHDGWNQDWKEYDNQPLCNIIWCNFCRSENYNPNFSFKIPFLKIPEKAFFRIPENSTVMSWTVGKSGSGHITFLPRNPSEPINWLPYWSHVLSFSEVTWFTPSPSLFTLM
jgi:hypothetical protein